MKNTSLTEESIATYNKRTKTVDVVTTKSNNIVEIDTFHDITEADPANIKKATNLVTSFDVISKSNDFSTAESRIAIRALSGMGVNIGNDDASTIYGDYGYKNYWSYGQIRAGKDRPSLSVQQKSLQDDYVLGRYEDFMDEISNIKNHELIIHIAIGGEVLSGVVALIFAPEPIGTKGAAILAVIGITGTLLISAITWNHAANAARTQYDRILKRVN